MDVFMGIGFGSTIELVPFDKSQMVTFDSKFVCCFRNSNRGTRSRSDNLIGSPHGFIIYWIVILKIINKVTEVIDVKNWLVDNSQSEMDSEEEFFEDGNPSSIYRQVWVQSNGYLRKGQKTKPKRQNQARERKERERKVKSKPKVNPDKVKVKCEADIKEMLNWPTRASLAVAVHAVRKGAAAEGMTIRDYVWRGHDLTSFAVMTEDGAAVTGLEIVATSLVVVELTGNPIYCWAETQTGVDKQETASKSRQARDGKQESSSKSRQARVDKKETGGKQETAIDEKAENTVKECTNWKDKKKDKEQEALLISEDTAFVITGENVGPKPKPGNHNPLDKPQDQNGGYKGS
ncbi:reverse transcriptase domain-containing protein [Tanacetum coccineum]